VTIEKFCCQVAFDPYCPNLVPIQRALEGRRFSSDAHLEEVVEEFFEDLSKDFF
jgi:hypothetical protein